MSNGEAEGITRGRFVWYDLMTPEPEAAVEFYRAVTGWEPMQWDEAPEGMPPYTMWGVDGAPVGGVSALPPEASDAGVPAHWLGYVETPDVDRTFERAKELGATPLMGPEDVPTVGRMVVLNDPQGAVVSFFQPASPMELHPGPPRPGDFSWHELATADREAAWDFYSELFEWEKTSDFDMGDGWMYDMFTTPGEEGDVGAVFRKSDEMPGPPAWTYYVHVPDLDASVTAVEAGGGEVLSGPMEVPGGDRVAVCRDPHGAVFALHGSAAGG